MQSSRIERLEKDVADQITSQQIIPTLHECVKQLIDNSIDAKATIVRVQLQEYGKVRFSVFDDGMGICDVQKLGEGGNTSKLKIDQGSSEDYLQGIRTLGFRGQAINSIAHLCREMIIHTSFKRSHQAETKIIETSYSVTSRRIIQEKDSVSNQTFTHITVSQLFYNLPVRYQQLKSCPKQNLKKVYDLIFQISLIYPEITFILINVVDKKPQIVLEVQKSSKKSSRESIMIGKQQNDYFHKKIDKVLWKERIQLCFPKILKDCLVFGQSQNVEGYILNTIDSGSSKKNHKFSKNFQYTFLNRRPINPIKQICKLFDAYYKRYNPYTKYVFFINLRVQPNHIDVNLSPNKRDIFIKKEMLEEVVKQIKNMIEKEVIEKITNLQQFRQSKIRKSEKKQEQIQENSESEEQKERLKKKRFNTKQEKYEDDSKKIRQQVHRPAVSQSFQDKQIMGGNYLANYVKVENPSIQSKLIEKLNQRTQNMKISDPNNNIVLFQKKKTQKSYRKIQEQQQEEQQRNSESVDKSQQMKSVQIIKVEKNQTLIALKSALLPKSKRKSYQIDLEQKEPADSCDKSLIKMEQTEEKCSQRKIKLAQNPPQCPQIIQRQEKIEKIQKFDSSQKKSRIEQIESKNSIFSNNSQKLQQKCCNQQHQPIERLKKFQVPSNIEYVTQQTKGDIKKQDFRSFHIHGQFNKGFILSSFKQQKSLYIIDQHAAEQKRLFEHFSQSKPEFYYVNKEISITPLQVDQIQMARQQLIRSGFTFTIADRTTLKIMKCPSHFKKNFGIDEFMYIAETGKNIKQIPAFYNSAASKACRSAVMIGDELGRKKMIDIVHKMADLKSPWNCPHGRPSLITLGKCSSIVQKIKSPKPIYRF